LASADSKASKGGKVEKKYNPGGRLSQIKDWLADYKKGECLVVLDECHRAKNLASETGVWM
jgi:hypothetical protein